MRNVHWVVVDGWCQDDVPGYTRVVTWYFNRTIFSVFTY